MARWLVALVATTVLSVSVAYAADLGGVSSSQLASSSASVQAPPVVFTGVQWGLVPDDSSLVDRVFVTLDCSPDCVPSVSFDVWLTLKDSGGAALFDSATPPNAPNHVTLDGAPVQTTFSFSPGVATSLIESLAVTVCRHVSSHADDECKF